MLSDGVALDIRYLAEQEVKVGILCPWEGQCIGSAFSYRPNPEVLGISLIVERAR